MKFHLNYSPARAGFEIEHGQKVVLSGSCFASEIGQMLADHRFNVLINPDGILFNPVSLYHSLDTALHMRSFDRSAVLVRDGVYLSYQHHSSVSGTSEEELLKKIRHSAQRAQDFLWSANCIVITFGTAHVYYHRALGRVIGNCHRQPAGTFEKRMVGVGEIVSMYDRLIHALKNVNPGVKIIFTVSPVKYLADGLAGNSLSKATLLLAAHELVKRHDDCHYFPAYELVTDDLRDYRFYKEDLAHPNELAIRYVWEKFSACYFAPPTLELNRQIARLNDAMRHRPLSENGEDDKLREFIRRQREEVMRLDPTIDL
jgi:hypothetical protein